jgi:quercetin dioxygenase-like cupin family protein
MDVSGELSGKPAAVAGLIDYQTGAIVSRTLVDKAAGTITLFAFNEGQALSEHTAPFDALVLVVDGEAVVTLSGKPHTVGAGEMVLMPANEPHAVAAPRRFKMLLIMIRA